MFCLKRIQPILVIVVGIVCVAGCADLSKVPLSKISSLSTGSTSGMEDPIVNGTPILLYSHIARNIKRCWLKPETPVIKNHVYFARATPNKEGGIASITLNESTKKGKRGPAAFKIDLLPEGQGKTHIQIHNFRFDEAIAQRLTSDVRFWSHGQIDCNNKTSNEKITSIPPGTTISQMPAKQ